MIVTSLKLSPTILTCSGRTIGLSSTYVPPLTLITSPADAIPTAPLIVAFASPNFLPVLLSFPSFVTYNTFVTVTPAPTLTTSVAIPV